MSKPDPKQEFINLSEEYHKCLNHSYDLFFEGKDVDFKNVCTDILEKIKTKGDYYKNFQKEYVSYQEEMKKQEKK